MIFSMTLLTILITVVGSMWRSKQVIYEHSVFDRFAKKYMTFFGCERVSVTRCDECV